MPKTIQRGDEATGGFMLESLLIWAIAMLCFFLGVYCGIKIEKY